MSDLTKPKDDSLTKPKKFGTKTPLQQRVAQAAQAREQRAVLETISVASLPNRIGLMLDVSGSMSGSKIEQLRVATEAFLDACNPANTAVAITTFEPLVRIEMSNVFSFHKGHIPHLIPQGSTPMSEAMLELLSTESMTRGVLVSDGAPNDTNDVYVISSDYKEAGIPIDTVHIGDSDSGEEVLQRIASITGGLYMKFKDSIQFGRAFRFLTPAYRALLADASVRKEIGAA
jgi:Mg-chelatase subunit ChlD